MSEPRAATTRAAAGGRRVLVTGAGRGLGRAVAAGLAEAGDSVCCLDRDEEGLRESVEQIRQAGGAAIPLVCDLTDADQVADAVGKAAADGPIDGLVAVAGGTAATRRPFLELDLQTWDAMVGRNLTTAFLTGLHCSRHMVRGSGGSIVLISSIAARTTHDGLVHYSAAKGGVEQLMRGMAAELGPHGVRVNAIAPGSFLTPGNERFMDGTPAGEAWRQRTPLRRLGVARELLGAIDYLLSDRASYTTGSTITIDGGFSVV